MVLRAVIVAVLLLFSLLSARVDAAPQGNQAAADALFHEGRALVEEGKYAEGCAKLAGSQELDPAAGTLLALADCYEKNGQTATAWTTFKDAEALARKVDDTPRADEAARRIGLLEPNLSKLVIELAPDNRPEGLMVQRNAAPLDPNALNSAVPVDPGEYTIEATAPGKQSWSKKVTVEPKPGLTTVRIPLLEPIPAPPVPKPVQAPAPRPALPPAPLPPPEPSSWSVQRKMGLLLGGVGLVGLVLGTDMGITTLSTASDIEDRGLCKDDHRCTEEGYNLQKQGEVTANISNAAFAVGGAALVAGVVLFVTAPPGEAKEARRVRVNIGSMVGPGAAGLSLRGEW